MTGAPPPPQVGCLPCQLDPESWFDRHNRADALADCLRCPARRWCAREALECRASWGLWAGVWIDGRHDDAAPYLQAVVTDALPKVCAHATSDREPQACTPLRRPNASSQSGSAAAAVLARSSGHCEVLAEGCHYVYERLVSRRSSMPSPEVSTPPDLFAACDSCADMAAALDSKLATRFGYVTDAHRDPAYVPFYWRRSRWVLLDHDGWLTEMLDEADTA